MLQKRNILYNINNNKSDSINNEKSNSNFSNTKIKYNKNIFTPSKTTLVQSKSQINIFPLNKKIKISFNKFHQYIKNIKNDQNQNTMRRPVSLYFKTNKLKKLLNNNNNNRGEIENDYSYINFYNKNTSNSRAKTSRTLLLSHKLNNNNIRHKKLNKLNIGLNSQSTKNSSFKINCINNTNDFTPIKFQNIAPLTFNKLKNSKFFAKTKYVKGLRNRHIHNNFKNIKSPSLSTYNINFPSDEQNDIIYKTIDSLIKKQLMDKIKITQTEETSEIINNINPKMFNKKSEIENEIEKAKFYDFFPIILNHIKQKNAMGDIYNEYYKYLANISKSTSNNNNNYSNKKTKFEFNNKSPKIKYLFLENIINNLKHMVKFINIKNNEQLEQSVINIIRNEYNKIKRLSLNENKLENIKDFLTYGYEYEPKREILNQNQLTNFEEKGFQTFQINKDYKEFDNKQNIKSNKAFFVDEKQIEENQLSDKGINEDRISLMKNIYINHNIKSKKRIFEKIGYQKSKSRNNNIMNNNVDNNELKEDLHKILSSYNTHNENINDIDNIVINTQKKIIKKNENSLLKNAQLKKLNISPNKFKKSKLKPKFIKIKVRKENLNEEMKDNIKMKLDNSDKNDDTIFNSFSALKDSYDNIIMSKKGKNEKNLDKKNEILSENKNEEIKKENENKENINKIKNNIILKNISILSKVKINNIENINVNNIPKDEIDKKDNDKDQNENKKEEEEENEEKDDESQSEISSQIEEEKKLIEEKKEKAKSVRLEEEVKKKDNDLKKKENEDFMKSVENILTALNHIKEVSKPKNKIRKSIYNELMFHKKEDLNNSRNSNKSQGPLNTEHEKNNFHKRISLKERHFEEKEISVSSLSNSSISELKEFIKIKKVQKKTKKQAFDEEKRKIQYRRRGALMNASEEAFQNVVRSKDIAELNSKMKKIYEEIHKNKKRAENQDKNKKKKVYAFSFSGFDLNNMENIEKRKKVNLNILKEDIKYKITQGKFSFVEMYEFQNFSRAIMAINFDKYKNNLKKLKERLHAMEKYFQMYYNDLIEKERQNNDEKRINKFLYNLKEEIGETIPLINNYKGFFCRSVDFNKEGDLSILNQISEKNEK